MGINITVVSYLQRLCVAITSCPSKQPDIDSMGALIRKNWRDLSAADAAS